VLHIASSFSIYFSKTSILLSFALMAFSASLSICFNSFIENSLFILALFLIYLALYPNLSVDIVSFSLKILGEHVIINDVLEFPPSDS
jgi:hypothetical protein